jgi:hypothetical protein
VLKQEPTGDFASLVAECSQLGFDLPGSSGRKIEGNFDGENVNSDGGLVLLPPVD